MEFQSDTFSSIPEINQMYQSMFSRGKALRSILTSRVAGLLNLPLKTRDKLSGIVECIHQSSVLHDDVIDASPIRRGALSGWMQYSMKKAILAGDYLLGQAAEDVASLENIALMKLTASTLKKLVQGECLQDQIKNQETLADLNKVHELKTSSLFQWSLRAPFLMTHRYEHLLHKKLSVLGNIMGTLFQRADDLLDFDIRNKEKKATFKDIEEGYFNSFAIYLCENESPAFRSALKACRSLKQVTKLKGEKKFSQALKNFDKINQQIITQGQKEIQTLPLTPKEHKVITELKAWPSKLYWRQNV